MTKAHFKSLGQYFIALTKKLSYSSVGIEDRGRKKKHFVNLFFNIFTSTHN